MYVVIWVYDEKRNGLLIMFWIYVWWLKIKRIILMEGVW